MTVASDPWRLCCAECGDHTLYSLKSGWRCRGCGTKLKKLKDKRTGNLISKGQLSRGIR